jgi:hypothetical protein
MRGGLSGLPTRGEHRPQPAVGGHVFDPFARVPHVKRDEVIAAKQDRHHPDYQGGTALPHNTDG